ncbi:hypothetical protein [Geminocystis sp. NIES-3709]|uniref:hypothetical protein n=1 Tax=Geminocystis sp. NIES-3709 TaxID=1617448 RepID=UPI0005FC589E|nr:hypothetical protein [Geminocystis sp. NIES-3709]BAQ64207.1 hypothetical protein GM3709_972 [Geminocystis sp. NIES-3709]
MSEIIPAIIGLIIAGGILGYFLLKQKLQRIIFSYLLLEQKPKGIIFSCFFFLISGFLFQIMFTSGFNNLKNFASEYKDVFSIPIFTILATATGIFIGNIGLRFLANNKEKREISILFINAINSQLRSLAFINSYLTSYKEKDIAFLIITRYKFKI